MRTVAFAAQALWAPFTDVRNALLCTASASSRRRGDWWIWALLLANVCCFLYQVQLRYAAGPARQVTEPASPDRQSEPETPTVHPSRALPEYDLFNLGPLEPFKPGSIQRTEGRSKTPATVFAPVVMTVLDEKTASTLQRFVGSVHQWHPEWSTWVAVAPGVDPPEELEAWHNVHLVRSAALLRHVCTHADFAKSLDPASPLHALRASSVCDGKSAAANASWPSSLRPLSWAPLAVHLALQDHGHTVFIDAALELSGWNDAAFKAVQRDGALLVGAAAAPLAGVWGFGRAGANATLARLVRCSFRDGCGEAATGGGRESSDWATDTLASMVGRDARQPPQLVKVARQATAPGSATFRRLRGDLADAADDDDGDDVDELQSHEPAQARPGIEVGGDEKAGEATCHLLRRGDQHVHVEQRIPAADGWHPRDRAAHKPAASSGAAARSGTHSSASGSATTVAILVPALSPAGGSTASALETLVGTLLPSLAASVAAAASQPRFAVYVAFERGYADMDRPDLLAQGVRRAVGAAPIAVTLLSVPPAAGATAAWNAAGAAAVDDGAELLALAHADSRFPPPWLHGHSQLTWFDVLAAALRNNSVAGGVGVAAPLAFGGEGRLVFTHALLHRRHVELFGAVLPWQLHATEGLMWLSRVYGVYSTVVIDLSGGNPGMHTIDAPALFSGNGLWHSMHEIRGAAVQSRACAVDENKVDVQVRVARDALTDKTLT